MDRQYRSEQIDLLNWLLNDGLNPDHLLVVLIRSILALDELRIYCHLTRTVDNNGQS